MYILTTFSCNVLIPYLLLLSSGVHTTVCRIGYLTKPYLWLVVTKQGFF